MIPGLQLIENVIDEETENQIIDGLDKEVWSNTLSRRTQHYGYEYNYRNKGVHKKAPDFPKAVQHIAHYLKQSQIIDADQCIVNEYRRNQGISKHIDSPDFGPVVVSLSLNADTKFIFRQYSQSIEMIVPRRSLLVLTNESRYNWTHEIPKITTDQNYRRISLTFRTVKK